jgi:hypothetical protein
MVATMGAVSQHRNPAIHDAMWPVVVGKGPGSEPCIDLDAMLTLTADAQVGGVKFDGVYLFYRCRTSILIQPTMTSRSWLIRSPATSLLQARCKSLNLALP